METRVTVTKLDWVDVNKVLYAVQAYSPFSLEYNKEFYNNLKVGEIKGDNKSVEDMATDVVMNGGTIYIYDDLSNGKKYNKKAEVVREDFSTKPYVMYPLTLDDFKVGFENLLNRKYDCDNKIEEDIVNESANHFMEGNPNGDDLYPVLQVIMFNEIVYPL